MTDLMTTWWVWLAAIALTTLTTKQHFVVDVVGGVVVAALCVAAVELRGGGSGPRPRRPSSA